MIHSLFVYGSLRSGFQSPAYEYISRYFQLVGNGKIPGELYDLGEYPAAIPSTSGKHFIVGELYTIKSPDEFDWAFAQLDDYEGVTTEQGETALYKRELTDVLVNDTVVKAWVYWYTGDVAGSPSIPSGDILDYLRRK